MAGEFKPGAPPPATRIGRFAARPLPVKLGFFPAWFLLGLARIAKNMVPFRMIARALGPSLPPGTRMPASDRQHGRALLIGRTVRLAARYTPWTSDCYPQALAAAALLRLGRLPFVVTFGVKPGEQARDMMAHCWVMCGEVHVCGSDGEAEFTGVASFGRSGRSA
ncbi:MAG: lasso peptide biosynthesis B2 protein [Sphingomonadaceae bacterium]|nr:lasso peptide biosynthesis B2 protein [Sphingomonadaceae bacterium]